MTASAVAREIRAAILAETGLTASAGISYCKFLAKIASDQRKPDGQFVIPPEHGAAFIAALPIDRFHGIGPATAARMRALGIETGADLRAMGPAFLEARFGKSGRWYWNIAQGIDNRAVSADRIRKSIGAETTFFDDLSELAAGQQALAPLAEKVWRHAERLDAHGRTVTVKVKFANFQQITRAHSLNRPVSSGAELLCVAQSLLAGVMPDPRGVRLLGVTLSGFGQKENLAGQLDLFG